MARPRNEETGEYNTHLRAKDALDVFRGREDRAKPLGSVDIQDALGWSRGTVHNKLDELVERGALETRTIGSRTRVWWEPLPREAVSEHYQGLPTSPEDIREWVDIPARNEEAAQDRARAIHTAYELLRERGVVTTEELQNEAAEVNSDDESSSLDGHWVNYLRDALRVLPGTVPPARTTTEWQFVDPDGELANRLDVELDEWVAAVDTPGTGKQEAHLRALLQLTYEYLQQEGEARKGEFEQILPSYTGQYSGFEGLWTYYLREALKDESTVEYDSGRRYSVFRYTG